MQVHATRGSRLDAPCLTLNLSCIPDTQPIMGLVKTRLCRSDSRHGSIQCQALQSVCAGETISEAYTLEYGSDRIEMHLGHITEGQRVLLIDDLIATGGTLGAGIKLMGMHPLPV